MDVHKDPRINLFLHQSSYSRLSLAAQRTQKAKQLTITASSGAGKTTLIELLQEEFLGFEFRSGGSWFRKKAQDEGFGDDIGAFCKYNREHPELGFDLECDAYLHHASLLFPDNLIEESRFSHCAVPNGYHVLLTCPLGVRALRRHADEIKLKPHLLIADVEEKLRRRDEDDEARLTVLYPDYKWPQSDYDLVIPTDKIGKRQAAEMVIAGFWEWYGVQSQTLPSQMATASI